MQRLYFNFSAEHKKRSSQLNPNILLSLPTLSSPENSPEDKGPEHIEGPSSGGHVDHLTGKGPTTDSTKRKALQNKGTQVDGLQKPGKSDLNSIHPQSEDQSLSESERRALLEKKKDAAWKNRIQSKKEAICNKNSSQHEKNSTKFSKTSQETGETDDATPQRLDSAGKESSNARDSIKIGKDLTAVIKHPKHQMQLEQKTHQQITQTTRIIAIKTVKKL